VNGSVAVIIVQYRSGSVEQLIQDLSQQGVARVVVIDNGVDESFDRTSHIGDVVVHELAFGLNLGYGAAINRGLAMVEESMVVIANPDIVVHPGAIDALATVLEANVNVGAVGPKVVNSDGSRYPSFRRFPSLWQSMWHGAIGWLAPSSSATRSYRMSDIDPELAVVVPWISGAFLACPTSALRRIAGFDTKYRLYLEDVDLCRRLTLVGYQIVYQPLAVVTHYGGRSSDQRRLRALLEHHRSMAIYAAAERRSTLSLLVVEFGIALRCGLSLVRASISGSVRN
jgi:N-acetylglucosaminyl-diphospho-decaprenol L-rhamnosyltransferase